ncbi:MAG TPA: bifunctional precorrin-2 dehydrogenase/sirohydrochlorin ferrochelatase [Verrucomicrobiae bacterium]|nr:bifunctional precorrin-2 dehydrogenase/sirohydrochlorin ferrochelatase [Verrucomicrobiae bacterium]
MFPVNLRVAGKSALVVGGGGVALRKVRSLLEAGAAVSVLAPAAHPELRKLAAAGRIRLALREYRSGDLQGAFLVFAATDDAEVNAAVAAESDATGTLCCVTDSPAAGSFTSPSTVRRGDLLLTVSTGGRFPALAAKIASELAGKYGPEWGEALQLLGELREKLLTAKKGDAYNGELFRALAAPDWGALPAEGRLAEIDNILLVLLGPEYSLERLKGKD